MKFDCLCTHISDSNECTLGTHNCHGNATCMNTDGSFSCACDAGYSGNGVNCSGSELYCPFVFIFRLTRTLIYGYHINLLFFNLIFSKSLPLESYSGSQRPFLNELRSGLKERNILYFRQNVWDSVNSMCSCSDGIGYTEH